MQPQIKPMPYGAKLAKLYAGKFYLPPSLTVELIRMCENRLIQKDGDAIQFIEEHGSWLDG